MWKKTLLACLLLVSFSVVSYAAERHVIELTKLGVTDSNKHPGAKVFEIELNNTSSCTVPGIDVLFSWYDKDGDWIKQNDETFTGNAERKLIMSAPVAEQDSMRDEHNSKLPFEGLWLDSKEQKKIKITKEVPDGTKSYKIDVTVFNTRSQNYRTWAAIAFPNVSFCEARFVVLKQVK